MLRPIGAMTAICLVAGQALAQAQEDGGIVTKRYDSGAIYQGRSRTASSTGPAATPPPTATNTTGEWVNGVIEGEGVARFPTARSMRASSRTACPTAPAPSPMPTAAPIPGEWVDGVINGEGKAVYPGGMTYEGEFANSAHHGRA